MISWILIFRYLFLLNSTLQCQQKKYFQLRYWNVVLGFCLASSFFSTLDHFMISQYGIYKLSKSSWIIYFYPFNSYLSMKCKPQNELPPETIIIINDLGDDASTLFTGIHDLNWLYAIYFNSPICITLYMQPETLHVIKSKYPSWECKPNTRTFHGKDLIFWRKYLALKGLI